jgi:phosphate:Na+ symporter
MKSGAEPLRQAPWFSILLTESHNSLIMAFIGGAGFSFVTQSSTAVSILAIGLASTGLIAPFPTMMALYGANVGSSFSRMLLSSGVKGSMRQLTAYQDLFKITGAVIFVSLLYVEVFGGVPLVRAFVQLLSARLDRQMAFVFLLFNLGTAALFSALLPWICLLLARWFPADEKEDLSTPQFIYEGALEEPATALDLLEKEQLRLAKRLRTFADALRGQHGSVGRSRTPIVHASFSALVSHIEHFQHQLVDQQLGSEETERLTKLQNRLSLIVYLEDSLRELLAAADGVSSQSRLGELVSTFVEGLDFVLMTLLHALETGEREQIDLLVNITEDRGELMEQIRQNYLAEEETVGTAERAVLLQVTSVFERIIWMTQRLARLLDRPGRPTGPELASALFDESVARG